MYYITLQLLAMHGNVLHTDFSDHCRISTCIYNMDFNPQIEPKILLEPSPRGYTWGDDSCFMFQRALNLQSQSLINVLDTKFECNHITVDKALKQFNDIVLNAANHSLKKIRKKTINTRKTHKNKKWYGPTLIQLKREVKRYGKLLCQNPQNQTIRAKYFTMLKSYKKKCKLDRNQYKSKIYNMMEGLQTNNPKEYWKLVEELTDRDKTKSTIKVEKLFTHYKNLNSKTKYKDPEEELAMNEKLHEAEKIKIFSELDYAITEKEVLRVIKTLKNGKAYGQDLIKNEMLKYGQHWLSKPLTKLFNIIMNSQYYPLEWSRGRIVSIHKKGDTTLPENYRGITISSCLGKTFNAILNNRLSNFLEERKILCIEQCGFKKKHRTTDHMFVLKNIMHKYKIEKKALYLAFVDFKQAFDRVRHKELLYKLLQCGISNKFYAIIKSMYSNIMLSVQSGDGLNITLSFLSLLGVRQGDNLSPTLFSIFVNDLPSIFTENCKPACFGDMKINCMMYADDLIIMSESNTGLQESMNKLDKYCDQWGLTVNINKTKCMITKTNSNININSKLFFKNNNIEIVDKVKYLGIEFSHDGNVQVIQSDLYKKGLKAYFKLMRALNPLPSPKILLNLFDHLIKPVLLYGCEIWSPVNLEYKNTKEPLNEKASFIHNLRNQFPFITKYMEKIDYIEKLHLKFCKAVLGVHSKASNLAVYSELGRYPLFIDQIILSLKYLNYIETETENKFLKQFYKNLLNDKRLSSNCNILKMRLLLNKTLNFTPVTSGRNGWKLVKKSIRSYFDMYWCKNIFNDISNSKRNGGNKMRTFRLFKSNIAYEQYLNIKNFEKRKFIARFRISAHKLKIETGRYNSNNCYIKAEDRKCIQCDTNSMEDEFHFLIDCDKYESLRNDLFSKCETKNKHFNKYDKHDKFLWILTNEDIELLNYLGDFIVKANKVRNE